MDPDAFLQSASGAERYLVIAPSGHIACGILVGDASIAAGCQTDYAVPQVDCGANPSRQAPLGAFDDVGRYALTCTTEGIFWPDDQQAHVLAYGHQITVGDYTIASTEQGLWMLKSDGSGFRVNRGEGMHTLP